MSRYASVIRFESADGSTVVTFTGCRGYLVDCLQFLDDDFREAKIVGSEGSVHIQSLPMGDNPHRSNLFGVTMENVEASKVLALVALGKAAKAEGTHIKTYLTDALVNLDGIVSRPDPDAQPFWVTTGRESEGMVQDVNVRLITLQ